MGWTCSEHGAGKKISRKCWSEGLKVRDVGECMKIMYNEADPIGGAAQGVGMRPLTCWDCGFETRREHGCLPLVGVACCQIEISASG